MPQETFEVAVIARENPDTEQMAIANCAKYLAYADQTDTFGYHAHVESVDTGKHASGADVVFFKFTAPITGDDDLKAFMDEMSSLSRVMSVERAHKV